MRDSQLFATLWLGLFETPITADKRLRYASPKLLSATSFIRKTLYSIAGEGLGNKIKGDDIKWN